MWAGSSSRGRSTGNSALAIQLRQTKAAENRETQRIQKQTNFLERHWAQNVRKLSSLQRSLFVLMGKDPYSNCTREEALFEHNQPGFCYKRDGTPRYMRSLQESKSRRIINDLDGKQGLNPDPAINVVSDSPQLAEVLSSPELVQILCELRNTAAIMADEGLFSQFSKALDNTSRNVLIGFEGPLDYLKQYRKNLIQEFFDTLKSEAEIKFFMAQNDSSGKSLFNSKHRDQDVKSFVSFEPHPSESGFLGEGSVIGTRIQSLNDMNRLSGVDLALWNQAVIDGLREAQEEERKRQFTEENGVSSKTTKISLPPLYSDKAIGLLTKKYLEESRKETKPPSKRASETVQNERKNLQQQQRKEFDNFVRHLISKIEILDDMGQKMLAYQRKRPNRHAALIEPLVRLLRKQSLFTSLTNEDLLLSFYKTVDVEDPSVRYFKVPSSSLQASKSIVPSSITIRASEENAASKSDKTTTNRGTTTNIADLTIDELSKHVHFVETDTSVCESAKCFEGSMRKVGCKACRENVRLACNKMQKRDVICAATKDAYSWKIPEMSSWPHEYKAVSLRNSSRSLKERISKDKAAKMVYLVPPPKSIKYKKGAPTPRFPRRILPPDFSTIETQSLYSARLNGNPDLTSTGRTSQPTASTWMGTNSSTMTMSNMALKKSSTTTARGVDSSHSRSTKRNNPDSWTLQVSKMDIMRLRHELETDAVKDKMADFEQKFLNFI